MHYEDVKIKFADNGGFIVCYTQVTYGSGTDTYSGPSHNWKEEVFSVEQEQEAMDRAKELHALVMEHNGMGQQVDSAGPSKAVPEKG